MDINTAYSSNYNIYNNENDTDKPVSQGECETCKRRKYQDASNENVSYKSPTHIAPGNAYAAVRAHEGEHVSNAYTKAALNNGTVVSATVSVHTARCPECGRVYVSGGTTTTQIRYNPDGYAQNAKRADEASKTGSKIDAAL